jgi:ligand-binding sensor domain-containing protein
LKLGKATDRNRVKITLFCVFEDSKHRIWIGSDYGLYLYKRETDSFVRFSHNPKDTTSLSNDVVKTITEDSAGNLWLGTVDGLNKLPAGQTGFVRYKNTGPGAIGLNSNEINCVAADKEGELWMGTNAGLNKFNPITRTVTVFEPDPENIHSLTSKNVKCAYIDKQGIYWFGTFRGGINIYDKNRNLFNLKLSNNFQENSNKAAIITSLAENKNGNVFIGTDDEGLLEFDRKTEKLRRVAFPKGPNGVIPIISMALARNNELYIGSFAHGLFILDVVTGRLQNLKKGTGVNDLNSNDIFSLKEDSKGNIWVGTNGAGVNVLKDKKVIVKLTPNPNGPNEEALPVNGYARAFAEDSEGNMWIGSHGAGLAMYNTATHSFKVFTRDNSQLPSDKIEALLCDRHGNIWVGTYGGGLSLFDKAKNQFINFSEKDGLQNTTIYQVVEDLHGRIWLSTNTGIGCFDLSTKSFRNFNNQHGVQNNNFVHGSGIRLTDGELFFGGLQGFNYFDPAALTINHNVPAVLLTDLKISNK